MKRLTIWAVAVVVALCLIAWSLFHIRSEDLSQGATYGRSTQNHGADTNVEAPPRRAIEVDDPTSAATNPPESLEPVPGTFTGQTMTPAQVRASRHISSRLADNEEVEADPHRLAIDPPLRSSRPIVAAQADPNNPGQAAPVSPAPPQDFHVMWDGRRLYETRIIIAPGDEVRRPATVTTCDRIGLVVAQYQGTAFMDAEGNTQIDARGAPVSGAHSRSWSPDSFKITPDHQVTTIDDIGQRRTGCAEPVGKN